MAVDNDAEVWVGVLALQGAFREHLACLRKLPGVHAVEVRTKEQLASVDGLIIPGGESTTMAMVAERWGLIPELRSFAAGGGPVWGTCAGLIFLADRASGGEPALLRKPGPERRVETRGAAPRAGQKHGGQALLGGLDCLVQRNFFGAQIDSFEAELPAPAALRSLPVDSAAGPADGAAGAAPGGGSFRALFIRAPAVLEAGASVEVLAEYRLSPSEEEAQGRASVAVAVRSKHLLATAFHPELTDDLRWHLLFVDMVRERMKGAPARQGGARAAAAAPAKRLGSGCRPADLPVVGARA